MSEPIDLAHLDRYICGDRGLLEEVLSMFMEQARGFAEDMHPDMDDEAWRLAAHTLKGASRGVGAFALGEVAAKAEKMIGANARAQRGAVLEELRRQCALVSDYAEKVLSEAA